MRTATATSADLTARILKNPLTMVEAAKLLPPTRANKKVAPQTVSRLCLKGVKLPDGTSLRLGHIRYNGKLLTCEAAIIEFIEAQQPASATDADPTPARSPAARRRASDRAAEALKAIGV